MIRLEFLGDAVLDYLVTRYLYEDPKTHYPGAITELRSAVVNNSIFASLAVQNSFHKFLNFQSERLKYLVDKYVKFETNKDLYYKYWDLESTNINGAEDVEAPKILSDVFEKRTI